MKRIAAISLALVIVFALVGCEAATRMYRNYPTNRSAYRTTDRSYRAANNGTYRAGTGTRRYNVGDAAILERGTYNRAGTGTTVPGISPYGAPYSAYGYARGSSPATRYGLSTPAMPTDNAASRGTTQDTAIKRGTKTQNNAKTQNNLKINKAV